MYLFDSLKRSESFIQESALDVLCVFDSYTVVAKMIRTLVFSPAKNGQLFLSTNSDRLNPDELWQCLQDASKTCEGILETLPQLFWI